MYQWCLGIVHHTCTPYKESYWVFSAAKWNIACIYKGRGVLRVNHIYHRFGLCCCEMESSVREERLSRDLQSYASFNRANLPEQTTTQSGLVHSVDHGESKDIPATSHLWKGFYVRNHSHFMATVNFPRFTSFLFVFQAKKNKKKKNMDHHVPIDHCNPWASQINVLDWSGQDLDQ